MRATDKILFKEVQSFRYTWVWWIMLIVCFGCTALIAYHFSIDERNSEAVLAGLISLGSILLAIILIHFMKLELCVTPKAIYCSYFPFIKKRTYTQDNVTQVKVRKYSAITEFGGWGIKYSISGKGWVYNVKGNTGLQLYLSNDKKVLIGTQQSDELSAAIEQVKKDWRMS